MEPHAGTLADTLFYPGVMARPPSRAWSLNGRRLKPPVRFLGLSPINAGLAGMLEQSTFSGRMLDMRKRSSMSHTAIVKAVTLSAKQEPEKNPAAVALGRLGGLKGGKARALTLSSIERS